MRDVRRSRSQGLGIIAPPRSIRAVTGALMATIVVIGCGGVATPTPSPLATTTPGTIAVAVATPSAAPTAVIGVIPTPSGTAEPSGSPVPPPGAETETLIAGYVATLQADPNDHDTKLLLGLAWYQLARETADPTDYKKADQAFDELLAADPQNAEAMIGEATIDLARHDFGGALALGNQALALTQVSRVYGVIGDAETELGMYDQAVQTVQTMVNVRPDLSSYSRVSYQRELHGELDGAISAMESAVEAGGPTTENVEYVRVLLGNLWFLKGDLDMAEASYDASLAHAPDYVFALAGLARVKAARGDLAGAITLYQQAADRVPFPEFLIALGETQEAAGDMTDAQSSYDYVRAIDALFKANGVNTDIDIALFESEHGNDPASSVALARQAYAATPNVRAADALAWSLYKDGQFAEARQYAELSLAIGSLDPMYHFHAGMIALAQGDTAQARTWLTEALAMNPNFSPLYAPQAQAALDSLPPAASASPMPSGSAAP